MITLKNVTREFRLDDQTTITPVRDVDLEIERGEFLMIVGRSGAGKTTLLNLCAGFVKPTSGHVFIDGKDIQKLDEKALSELRSQKIGFVFQTASMLPSLTVMENVAVPSMFGGEVTEEERLQRAAEVIDLVGLSDRIDALPKRLSGGETRRVAIARALMNRPEILIADEPTSDLDVQTELKIVAALRKINDAGVTVLMVTHSLELVPYATRALKMEDGQLLPLDGEVKAQALPLELGPSAGTRSRAKRAGLLSELVAWLRAPAHAALAALGIALIALLIALIVVVSRVGTGDGAAATTGSGSGPGPVVGGMGASGSSGVYDPSLYSLYGNTGMYSSTAMGITWPLQVDPATGDAFKDPEELKNESGTDGVFEGKIEAERADILLGGITADLMTYNGTYPGPLIRVKRGDTLKIEFANSLPETTETNVLGHEKNHTNLSTHGLHVSPNEPADNVKVDVAPGRNYDYVYNLAQQRGGALAFIHPQLHGLAAEQLWSGMLATVLVEDEIPVLSEYESHVMVLKDITLSGNLPQAHMFMSDYMYGKEGSIVTMNGQVNPVLSMKPGQVQRWQILNGSNARFYRLYLENHLMYLVGTDGGLLDKPYPLASLLLAPGERADILVKAGPQPGVSRFLSLPYARQLGSTGGGVGSAGQSMVDQTTGQTWPDYTGGVDMMEMMDLMGLSAVVTSGSGMSDQAAGTNSQALNPAMYAYWPAVTDLLGLTTTETLDLLAQGNSLADVATSKGITAGALTQAIMTAVKKGMADYVTGLYLTQQQADQQVARLQPYVSQAMTTKGSTMLTTWANGLYGSYDPDAANSLGTYDTSGSSSGSMGGGGSSSSVAQYDLSAVTQFTLMTVNIEGGAVSDQLPTVVDPAAKRLAIDLSTLPKRTIVFNMDLGNAYINGMDYDIQPYTVQSRLGTYEVWEVVNPTGVDLPFHLQLNAFQVMAISGGELDYARLYTTTPAMKDTVIVPKLGSVTLLVPVQDFEGTAVFQSHILEHEDIGMMGQWQIGAMAAGSTPGSTGPDAIDPGGKD